MILDELFSHERVGNNGPSGCEIKSIKAALDADEVKVAAMYSAQTRYDVHVVEGELDGMIRPGTGNPVPIRMKHVITSTDGKRHLGFLHQEYPRRTYRSYSKDPKWFMLTQLD